jgi:hypothetical protein
MGPADGMAPPAAFHAVAGGRRQDSDPESHPPPGRDRAKVEEQIGMVHQARALFDLEESVAKRLRGAREIPPGRERQRLFEEIERFTKRLSAAKARPGRASLSEA